MSAPRQGEIVIEINHPKNGDVFFEPIGDTLRSRFVTYRTGARPKASLNSFHSQPIPGLRVHIDPKKRVGRITDPLGDPENKHILNLINRANDEMGRPHNRPHDDVEHKSLSEEDVIGWLYYMLKLLEGSPVNLPSADHPGELSYNVHPFAVLIQGTFPVGQDTTLALRQTGKVRNYAPQKAGLRIKPYVDPIPKEELEAVGVA